MECTECAKLEWKCISIYRNKEKNDETGEVKWFWTCVNGHKWEDKIEDIEGESMK